MINHMNYHCNQGLEDDFHQSSNTAYRIDAHLQRTYYNNADNLRILGCLRRLQDFEDAVDGDGSQVMLESAIGACAATGMDEYGHKMALQIGKKKKGKGIAAEDMFKTCLIGKYVTSSLCLCTNLYVASVTSVEKLVGLWFCTKPALVCLETNTGQ